jgi:choline-glycine betaine transporter
MASRTAVAGDESLADWMSSYTIFYWAWWVSWSPFVGLFIGRISRGRTIRQFIVGVLLVPSAISLLWFSIFGGGAIGLQERAEQARDRGEALVNMVNGVPDINTDTILFDMLEKLPVGPVVAIILMVVAVVLVAIFFVTGADSASIVMGGLSERGAEDPSRKSVIFWGVATGAVAAIMLVAGGDDPAAALNGLQNITIVSSVPFVLVMLLLCVALWKDLSKDPLIIREKLARHVLAEAVATGVERHDGEPFELRTVETAAIDIIVVPAEDEEDIHTASEEEIAAAASAELSDEGELTHPSVEDDPAR